MQDERELLIGKISRHDNWPVTKTQLGSKYIKHFIQFANSIDFLDFKLAYINQTPGNHPKGNKQQSIDFTKL